MKNNKGQTLVAFILLLPIILLFLAVVINVGFLYMEKRKATNVVKSAINYGLENINDSSVNFKVKNYIEMNMDNISSVIVDVKDQELSVFLIVKPNGLISNKLYNNYTININYQGVIENGKKRVIRK